MAFSVKYRIEGVGTDGLTHRIDFLFNGYSGGVLSLGDADLGLYKLEIGTLGADIFEPIRNARLNIRLIRNVSNVDTLIEDVENTMYGVCIVNLYHGSGLSFAGLLEPSLGDRGKQQTDTVQFIAKTGFDYLDTVPFDFEGRYTLAEVIANALSYLPYALSLKIDSEIEASGGFKTHEIRLDTNVYKSVSEDNEVTYRSCLFVLREVLQRFLLSITQFDGFWNVQCPAHYGGAVTVYEFDETGTYVDNDTDTFISDYNTIAYRQVQQYETERRKTPYTRADVNYKHGDLGGWKNGGFEEWETAGGTDWIPDWTRSDGIFITRQGGDGFRISDKDNSFARHVRFDPYFLPSTSASEQPQVGAVYIEATEGIYITSGSDFTLAWRGKWTIATQNIFSPEARAMFYRIKQGANYWDAVNRSWTTTETINQALVNSEWTTISNEIKDTPVSGFIELRIYGGIDHICNLKTGSFADGWNKTAWEFESGRGIAPNVGHFLCDAVDVVFKDADGATPTETRTSVSTNEYGSSIKSLNFYIGDGPTSTVTGRLTYLDASTEIDTTEWDGFGETGMPLDELLGRALVRYLGRPQKSVSYNFLYLTNYVRPIEALNNGVASWANYWYYNGLTAQFGGEYTEIVDFALDATKSVFKNAGSYRDLKDVGIFRSQSQSLFNTGTANVLTRLSASIPSGTRTTIPIEAIGSIALKAGDKIQLIDRDTGDIHTLTVTVKPTAAATTLTIAPYDFPKPIRIGSPIYRSQGDLLASVVQTDTIWRQMYKAEGVCYVSGNQNLGGTGAVTVTPTTAFIPSGTKIWIKTGSSTQVTFTTSADVQEGSTSVPFTGCTTQPSGATGGYVTAGLALKPEGFASMTEIIQNANEILTRASQTYVDAINNAVQSNTTSISQNAYEIALRAVRSQIINDINTITQTALRISPDKIILDGEVETTRNIRSDNYVAGTSGWIINGNGNAEFNDIAVRGSIIDQLTLGTYSSLDYTGVTVSQGGLKSYVEPANLYVTNGYSASYMTPTNLVIGGNTAWHGGNDGAGSGLDADLLDGYHASNFMLSSAGPFVQVADYDDLDVLNKIKNVDGIGSGLDADKFWGYTIGNFWRGSVYGSGTSITPDTILHLTIGSNSYLVLAETL